ncbi:MAG: cytochrome c3 family protein [Planctomycetota bacterium]
MQTRNMAEAMLAAFLLAVLVVPACSSSRHHRVLSFFFDGVPPPGGQSDPDELRDGSGPAEDGAGTPAAPAAGAFSGRPDLRQRRFVHAPYRERRCNACHDMLAGALRKQPKDGLCLQCHAGITEGVVYLHGPVAVLDCLACHHFHESTYPGILRTDEQSLCDRCHARDDLGHDEHHSGSESAPARGCLECHQPHGGGDPFFLRPSGVE